jgi:hypothetical protein
MSSGAGNGMTRLGFRLLLTALLIAPGKTLAQDAAPVAAPYFALTQAASIVSSVGYVPLPPSDYIKNQQLDRCQAGDRVSG